MGEGAGVVIANGQGDLITDVLTDKDGVRRLAVDTKSTGGGATIDQTVVAVGSPVPSDLIQIAFDFVRDSGDSPNMIVDGSITPVEFTFNSDPTRDLFLSEIRLGASTQDFVFDGESFGLSTALVNGILVEITSCGNTVEITTVKANEDFWFFATPGSVTLNNQGPKDILIAGFQLGGRIVLKAGSQDSVKFTVRDKLDFGGVVALSYLRAKVFALAGLSESVSADMNLYVTV